MRYENMFQETSEYCNVALVPCSSGFKLPVDLKDIWMSCKTLCTNFQWSVTVSLADLTRKQISVIIIYKARLFLSLLIFCLLTSHGEEALQRILSLNTVYLEAEIETVD